MFTKKKLFAAVLCVICVMMSFVAFAEPAEVTEAEATEVTEVAAVEVTLEAEENVPGYIKYVDAVNAESEAGEEAAEVERLSSLTEEELAAEEAAAEDAAKLEYAYSYIDGYADAIQSDENNKENIKDAVKEVRKQVTPFYATIWSILPAILAIALALITKEVYSSLFVGIVAGGLLYANFNFETSLNHIVSGGFVSNLSDSYNVGILLFLVLLGALVAIMNKAGGSAAFGRWASKHIKSRVGAQLATIALGVLIFVDDYFNCLTVGSVMRPVSDAKKVSRAKLSYLIDSTAAPICIIAPISSWAAAVAGFAPEGKDGISLFIQAIPYNFYAIFTIVMMIGIAVMKFDFGPMKLHEKNAIEKGDIFTTLEERAEKAEDISVNSKGKVIDLILPVVVLIISCIIGMIYSGGFFEGESFANAFSNCDASVGLALGSVVALVIVAAYFIIFRRGTIKFKELMECIPEGFKAMVPAILILTFAWTLKSMTDSVGAKVFIAEFVNNNASQFVNFLPAIIFLIAIGLSFSTGTSWGTFGILIPIVLAVFDSGTMAIIGMSACMAGAVCGDHCSPISDTTIMASAGAQCNHISHVSTQLPYAISVAAISFVMYLVAPFVKSAFILLPVGIVITLGYLFVMKKITANK